MTIQALTDMLDGTKRRRRYGIYALVFACAGWLLAIGAFVAILFKAF